MFSLEIAHTPERRARQTLMTTVTERDLSHLHLGVSVTAQRREAGREEREEKCEGDKEESHGSSN